MQKLTLYHCPGACSQVSVCALEKAGLPYTLHLIDVGSNAQASPDYAKVSGMQKVPALKVGDTLITENAAVITLVAELAPEAGIFPRAARPLDRAKRVEGLAFCGATLHPIVRGIFAPQRFTDGETAPVRSRAVALADKTFAFAEDRLARNEGWWLGSWSILDVYLSWTVDTAKRGGYEFTRFPWLEDLRSRLSSHACVRRMQQIEQESECTLSASRTARELA